MCICHDEGRLLTADDIGQSVLVYADEALRTDADGAVKALFLPSGLVIITFPLVVRH